MVDTLPARSDLTPLSKRRGGTLARWVAPGVVAGTAAGVCTVVALVDPSVPGRYPTCPFLATTGYFCPGCGSLRAMHQLLNGDVAAAFGFNPFLMVALPFLVLAWARFALRATGRDLPAIRWPDLTLRALPVAIVAFWVARNLPAFDALAP